MIRSDLKEGRNNHTFEHLFKGGKLQTVIQVDNGEIRLFHWDVIDNVKGKIEVKDTFVFCQGRMPTSKDEIITMTEDLAFQIRYLYKLKIDDEQNIIDWMQTVSNTIHEWVEKDWEN
jgi:hypothetical protein